MYAINEITRRRCIKSTLLRGIVYISDTYVEFGYFNRTNEVISVIFKNKMYNCINYDVIRGKSFFSSYEGTWIIEQGLSLEDKIQHHCLKGQYNNGGPGIFPYSFGREYEAENLMNAFEGKQIISEDRQYELSKYLKYTFGWEFETSMGYIPEDLCLENGLIPLRDGSITGIEYSTVVLEGNNGINLLRQQTEVLKQFCEFNKECSLHVHMGGYPVTKQAIWKLYLVLKTIESDLIYYIPPMTFRSSEYKKSRKDYCKQLPLYNNFEGMYESLAHSKFYGSLYQNHPDDPEKSQKWHIMGRYYWVNFINMLCYEKPKTVEFRFLRPTFNFERIYCWLAIFNALMLFAEGVETASNSKGNMEYLTDKPCISTILSRVYPEDLARKLQVFLLTCKFGVRNQVNNGDLCGAQDELLNDAYDTGKLLLKMEKCN